MMHYVMASVFLFLIAFFGTALAITHNERKRRHEYSLRAVRQHEEFRAKQRENIATYGRFDQPVKRHGSGNGGGTGDGNGMGHLTQCVETCMDAPVEACAATVKGKR